MSYRDVSGRSSFYTFRRSYVLSGARRVFKVISSAVKVCLKAPRRGLCVRAESGADEW